MCNMLSMHAALALICDNFFRLKNERWYGGNDAEQGSCPLLVNGASGEECYYKTMKSWQT